MKNDEAIKHLTSLRIHSQNRRLDKDIEALDKAIEVLEQQPCGDCISRNDKRTIHTDGLEEGIRCAMCTNPMANDRGCDGGCVVNESMYQNVLNVIKKQILEQQSCEDWHDVPSDKMTLGQARQAVKDLRKKLAEHLEQEPCGDAISRQAILDIIMPYCQDDDGSVENIGDLRNALDDIEALSPVTPKEKSEYEHDHEVVKAYNDGQAYILDKIKAEVELLGKDYLGCPQPQVVCDDVIKIIDKYRERVNERL